MSTLFVFGDSHTESYETTNITSPLYQAYYKWRGGTWPEVWATLLAEKLGTDVKNYGWAASTNEEIIYRICKHINEVKQGDTVIIQWTYAHRFKWVDQKKNAWQKMQILNRYPKIIHEQTFMDVINNLTHPLHRELIYNYEPMFEHLSKIIGFDLYYWSAEDGIINDLPEDVRSNRKYMLTKSGKAFQDIIDNGGQFIYGETNHEIHDIHMGELGHKVQAELFYKHIKRL